MELRAKKIWRAHLKALKKERERFQSVPRLQRCQGYIWQLSRRIYNISHLLQKADE